MRPSPTIAIRSGSGMDAFYTGQASEPTAWMPGWNGNVFPVAGPGTGTHVVQGPRGHAMNVGRTWALAGLLAACGGHTTSNERSIVPSEVVLAIYVTGEGAVRGEGIECR